MNDLSVVRGGSGGEAWSLCFSFGEGGGWSIIDKFKYI